MSFQTFNFLVLNSSTSLPSKEWVLKYDIPSQNLQQFSYAIEVLRLIYKTVRAGEEKELYQHPLIFNFVYIHTQLKHLTVTYQRKMLFICLRMKALRPRNLP